MCNIYIYIKLIMYSQVHNKYTYVCAHVSMHVCVGVETQLSGVYSLNSNLLHK